jgi:hypothetical protein
VTIDSSSDAAPEQYGSFKKTAFTTNSIGYTFYIDSGNVCVYRKTVDGGYAWGSPVTVKSSTCNAMDIWYDQWTPGDITGTKIHIATLSSTDLFYTELDTSSDTVQTAVDASSNTTPAQTNLGASAGNNFVTITKATDGELFMAATDNSDQYVLRCSATCTTGSNWSEALPNPIANLNEGARDSALLLPLAGGDVLLISNDVGENDLLSKLWTDSNSSWGAATTTIDNSATTTFGVVPPYAATLNPADNTIYLIYGADIRSANNGDIRVASYSGGSWTRKVDVGTNINRPSGGSGTILNSVGAGYDSVNKILYAAYSKSTSTSSLDPSLFNDIDQVFYKRSNDGGTTWSEEFGPFLAEHSTDDGAGLNLNFISPFKIYATWYQIPGEGGTNTILGTILEDRLVAGTDSRLTINGNVRFRGNLAITGAVAKNMGTFEIDHPLDPKNKLLFHSFVESPDAKNIYDGIAVLNDKGEARIRLPSYFQALNKDYRYQFFPHHAAMPELYIKQEVKNNAFVIAGGKPYGKVSWQVTGTRHDPYILANPIIVEKLKTNDTPVKRGECFFEPLCK